MLIFMAACEMLNYGRQLTGNALTILNSKHVEIIIL